MIDTYRDDFFTVMILFTFDGCETSYLSSGLDSSDFFYPVFTIER